MHKYPRIWIDYLNFLVSQHKTTLSRHTFDRALRALPVTQHNRIWPLYIKFVRTCNVPQTAIRVYRRYLKLEPGVAEEYIDYLVQVDQYGEAALQLARILNDESYVSEKGTSKHELWMRLSDIASKHPEQVKELKVEAMIRSGLAKFTNEVGRLWTALADYFIRLGNFDKARDVFEEGINSVVTIRDFNQIWTAYVEFEYAFISKQLADMTELEEQNDEIDEVEEDELQLRMAYYEDLCERQAILISNVCLRQNPHNVNEWIKRIKLFEGNNEMIVKEYTRALKTINPLQATGKTHLLWVGFAHFWEKLGKLQNARRVFEKAGEVNFKKLDHLAVIWTEYVEMELRNHQFEKALEVVRQATTVPKNHLLIKAEAPTPKRLFKSIRLWSLYADLEESFGTFLTCKTVYEKILDLRIATPLIILNYSAFLKEHKYFEESFKVYERGVAIFKFPNALDIWLQYLQDFMERYGGSKLERLRDLFEQAVESAPSKYCTLLYLMYADAEERFGLARHAMLIYDRAVKAVENDIKPKMFNIYIKRATENFGVTRTRQIFEKAIEILPDKYIKEFCLRYANLERKLGEIDRARAIYIHCSQFCPPARDVDFWEEWRTFEVKHGNVDTVREMFRIKRSVTAQYAAQYLTMGFVSGGELQPKEPEDKMKQLEEEEGDDEEDKGVVIETKLVPHTVFGSAAESDIEAATGRGASDRLKKSKK
eukprot:TRINITY_DN8048_c0_g2_i1.p1 TRINITY_DN8048_c0_g2~~TRINITY_DN8048_c0_g2_i1.p1  ORF type:complete len:711 (-),score=143.33 TRINITY_DN8048_c0_g2_i1:225-2357(-)